MNEIQLKLDMLANQRNQAMDQVVHLTTQNLILAEQMKVLQEQLRTSRPTESTEVSGIAASQPEATAGTDPQENSDPLAPTEDSLTFAIG